LNKDTWVEITDAKGAKLYKRTARAGENLSLSGTAPFKFIVRHPGAITLEYQNKVVDLSSHKGDRSARFTLSPEGIQ
jgi:cytoskeleton protein RodZ